MPVVPKAEGPSVRPTLTPNVAPQPLAPVQARGDFVSPRGATDEAFGSAEAKANIKSGQMSEASGDAFSKLANSLQDAQMRIQARNDAVARARDYGAFTTFGSDRLLKYETAMDMADPDTVKTFGAELDQHIQDTLAKHKGSSDSRLRLEEQLTKQRSAYLGEASAKAAKASQEKVKIQLSEDLSRITQDFLTNPTADNFNSARQRWNDVVSNYAGTLDPKEQQTFLKAGPAAFVEGAVSRMLEAPGGHIQARQFMQNNASVAALLDPKQQLDIAQRIQVAAIAEAREAAKPVVIPQNGMAIINGKAVYGPRSPQKSKVADALEAVATFEKLTGRKASPIEIGHALGLGSKDGSQSTVDKAKDFAEFYKARTGKDVTPAQWDRFFHVDPTEAQKTPEQRIEEINAARIAKGGKALDQSQVDVLLGLKAKQGVTLADKITEAESAVGTLSPDEIAKLGGFFVKDDAKDPNAMNGGADGTALNVMANLAPLFAAGQVTPLQERQFMNAVTNYLQPKAALNADTGKVEQRVPNLPEYVRKALLARGYEVPDQNAQSVRPGQQPQGGGQPQPGEQPQPGQQPQPVQNLNENQGLEPVQNVNAGLTPQGQPQQSQQQQPQGQPGQPQPGQGQQPAGKASRTIWERRSNLTGPVNRGKATANEVPPMGGTFDLKVNEDQKFVQQATSDLVRVLQNSPRLAEGERKQIMKEVEDLAGSVIDTQQAWEARAKATSEFLGIRLKNAKETVDNPKTTVEDRKQALELVNAIQHFQEVFGVPATVNSRAELERYIKENPKAKTVIFNGEERPIKGR